MSELFNDAQQKIIADNDIVVRVAKMIDAGAFIEWFHGTDSDALSALPNTRQKYKQSTALLLAARILALAAKTPDLSKQLADNEIKHWDYLGVPVSGNEELSGIINEKYQD